ncbi:DUF6438 domain-containing protein [Halosimplex amylolyticum]|uniref:DUF6438 domain-containing protein n=1 Tax=Halosimplex amylolyticum TaxID=3396616 RepID=UPI003F54E34D
MSTRPQALALCFAGLFLLSGCLGVGLSGDETATASSSAEALGARSGVPDYPDGTENVSIRYESRICGGGCSAYVIELCGNGTVYFAGLKDVNATGLHRYEVPQRNVTAVLNASYRTEFFAKDKKIGGDGEAHVEQLTVRVGNRSKAVYYVHPWPSESTGDLSALESTLVNRTNARPRIGDSPDTEFAGDGRALYERMPFCS